MLSVIVVKIFVEGANREVYPAKYPAGSEEREETIVFAGYFTAKLGHFKFFLSLSNFVGI